MQAIIENNIESIMEIKLNEYHKSDFCRKGLITAQFPSTTLAS